MIFLDNASTTRCDNEVKDVMCKYLTENYFNPSAKYTESLDIYKDIEKARREILSYFSSEYDMLFTSGASEANNQAILSGLKSNKELIISIGEHSSIYEYARELETKGRSVHYIGLTKDGRINEEELFDSINENTGLISVMYVSNETGIINDIARIAKKCKEINPDLKFHCDCVQAYAKVPLQLSDCVVDYITVSAHKIGGPKGVGALIYKKKSKITPLILGGGQERGYRSGTENVAGIIGFAKATEIAFASLEENFKYLSELKLQIFNLLKEQIVESKLKLILNGSFEKSSPYILSLSFVGIRGEVLLHALEPDILVGTGSACSSKLRGNRILKSMGKTKEEIDGNIRISFCKNTKYNAEELVKRIMQSVNRLS